MKIKFLLFATLLLCGLLSSVAADVENSSAKGAITLEAYKNFLNKVASTDPHHLYDEKCSKLIRRSGKPGTYHYDLVTSSEETPIFFLSALEAMRFCNYQSNVAQHLETTSSEMLTEHGIYELNGDQLLLVNDQAACRLQSSTGVDLLHDDLLLQSKGRTFSIVSGMASQASGPEEAIASSLLDGTIAEFITVTAAGLLMNMRERVPEQEARRNSEVSNPSSFEEEEANESMWGDVADHPLLETALKHLEMAQLITGSTEGDRTKEGGLRKEIAKINDKIFGLRQEIVKKNELAFVCDEIARGAMQAPEKIKAEHLITWNSIVKKDLSKWISFTEALTAMEREEPQKYKARFLNPAEERIKNIETKYACPLNELQQKLSTTLQTDGSEKWTATALLAQDLSGFYDIQKCNLIEKVGALKKEQHNLRSGIIMSCDTQILEQWTDETWNNFLKTVNQTWTDILKKENSFLEIALDDFHKGYEDLKKKRKSFWKDYESARYCLEDERANLLQDETARNQFFEDAGSTWERAHEAADFAKRAAASLQALEECHPLAYFKEKRPDLFFFWKIHDAKEKALKRLKEAHTELSQFSKTSIDAQLDKRIPEINTLAKAAQAMKEIRIAEKKLTEATKIDFNQEKKTYGIDWANTALSRDFIHQKALLHDAITKAEKADEKLSGTLDEVRKKYVVVNKNIGMFFYQGIAQNWEEKKAELEAAWKQVTAQVEASSKTWKQAIETMHTVKNIKLAWAKNIFRLAGQCSGNFSLGMATRKEAKALAALWVSDDSSLETEEENGTVYDQSDDGLRRYREISYKGTLEKHQMNFERRPNTQEEWTRKGEVTKSGHANGHLTIINAHDAADDEDDYLSLRAIELTAPQLKKAYYEIENSLKYGLTELQKTARRIDKEATNKEETITAWNNVLEAAYKGLNASPEDQPAERSYWEKAIAEAKENLR